MTAPASGLDREETSDETRDLLAALCAFDRYQASPGLAAAADILAGRVSALGFPVSVDRRRVDGRRSWWTFESPQPWAPARARLVCPGVVALDETTPCLVAVHSRATPPGRDHVVVVRLDEAGAPPPPGALVLVPAKSFRIDALLAASVERFATDAAARQAPDGAPLRGRIELPKHAPLTGFSLTRAEFAALQGTAGRMLEASLALDESADMPVVSWSLPGDRPGEVLLMAHLCHQMPGANDNASGVAGLVLASRFLRDRLAHVPPARRRTIRFLSGPEFTGPAAHLHGDGETPRAPPHAVIDLDMIGQAASAGGRFGLERAPTADGFALEALVATALDAAPELAGWRLFPFHGYSDNAIFAAGPFAAPTVQLCHDRDAYNHTDGDAPERLDLAVLHAAAGAAARAAAWAAAPDLREESSAHAAVRRHRRRCARRVEAVAGRAARAGAEDWAQAYRAAATARLVDGGERRERTPRIRLSGPLDLRGILAALPPADAAEIAAARARDKATLARLTNGVVALWEGVEPAEATRAASFALEQPFDAGTTALVERVLHAISRL
ncbi:M28 family peptidase [Salinarimonas sp.]|uniref:M28 family peptidase n=1 Tax=Salinarimonas sp. TaxID=2766526 RepID=UPI0032D93BB3